MSRLKYQPALDGVRAVAVVLVLLFHLGMPWMRAGYLGVSVFFTLSGYLITSLLLAEFDQSGSVSFRAFYARRARRLLPASLLVLVAVVVARLLGEFENVSDLRGQLLGALLQVYNWVQIAGSSSYGDLFAGAAAFVSPLEHFWSLAIEEQFYLLWPLALFLLCRRRAGARTPVLVLTVLSFAAAPLIAVVFGADTAYWSTPSRLPELLVGASVAVLLRSGRSVPSPARHAAAPALLLVVLCSILLPSGSGPAFTGWLWPFALVSGGLLVSLQPEGPMRRLLSAPPLVAVGKVSYGLYLVHWPVFTLLRQHGWRLDRPLGALVALAVTGAITVLSYVVLERPVRAAAWSPRRTAATAAVAALALLTAVASVPTQRGFLEADTQTLDAASIDTGPPPETLARPSTTVTTVTSSSTAASNSSTTTDAAPTTATSTTLGQVLLQLPEPSNRPVRVLVVGDSTAFYVGQGLAGWAVQHPQHAQVDLLWCQGCGFILDGTITSFNAAAFVETSRKVVEEQMPEAIRRVHPDVVVLMTTIDDVADRAWDMAEGTLTPRDPRFRERMRAQYDRITRTVLAAGVPQVVWVVPPVPTSYFDTPDLGERDRYLVQHEVIREVAAAAPGAVVCEMDEWFVQAGLVGDETWRPDGTHLDEQSAGWLVERWFGPWLIRTALGLPLG